MRRIRVHTGQALEVGEVVELEAGPARHLVRVLRQRPGNPVVLFNGDGAEYSGRIETAQGSDRCRVNIESRSHPATESPLMITLFQAIARGERMDWCLQKATELGVGRIVPVMTKRTEVRLDARRAERRQAHWQQVVVSACEQSARVRVPAVEAPAPLHEAVFESAAGLFLDPAGTTRPGDLDAGPTAAFDLVIGPEGGLTGAETDWLARQGLAGLLLGPRVLRTETAGPAAIAMLQSRFGDWD